MGRNRDKIAASTVYPFSSWEEYDEKSKEEFRRHQDALNKLVKKYGEGGSNFKREMWLMGRIEGKFRMEQNKHEAIQEKLDARVPEGPWPEHLKAQEEGDGFEALLKDTKGGV